MSSTDIYTYMLEKAIERLRRLDWRVLLAISRGQRALDLVSNGDLRLNLERNEFYHTYGGSVSLHEFRGRKESFLVSYKTENARSSKDRFIVYLEDLLLLSRVAERLGYSHERFDIIYRDLGNDERLSVKMYDCSTVHIKMGYSFTHQFTFLKEDDIVREIVGFEKEYSTPESISTMSPALKDLVVKAESV